MRPPRTLDPLLAAARTACDGLSWDERFDAWFYKWRPMAKQLFFGERGLFHGKNVDAWLPWADAVLDACGCAIATPERTSHARRFRECSEEEAL